jgi:NADH:ubiquinone oxidoreductase subunit 6 (subunit J)
MRATIERAILALGVVLIVLAGWWLRAGRAAIGLLELLVLVLGLGAFTLFIARAVEVRSWSERAQQVGLGRRSLERERPVGAWLRELAGI